jgi:hypothetical protein
MRARAAVRSLCGSVSTLALGLGAVPLASPAGASSELAAQTGTVVAALSTTTYGQVLVVGGKLGVDPLAGYRSTRSAPMPTAISVAPQNECRAMTLAKKRLRR